MTNESALGNQVEYWDKVAKAKTFSLPVNLPLLNTHLNLESKILDYGCGYGRTCQELAAFGYSGITGVDSSPEMVQRARQMHPALRFDVGTAANLPYAGQAFDAVLLVAVLTCIPRDDDQRSMVHALKRVLRVGGMLYIVDYVLQTDERNQQRYSQFVEEFGTYGVFRLEEGGVFRHHTIDWIKALLAGFEPVDISYADVKTMNGHPARAFQYLCQKR